METTYIKVRSLPDALVKVYQENPEEIIYIDNTNQDGETAPIAIQVPNAKYFIDVTPYPEN